MIRKIVILFVMFNLFFFESVNAKENFFTPEIPEVSKDKIICFALYTVHNGIMKMTAQLYPLDANDPKVVGLEIQQNGKWAEVAKSPVIEQGWIATFRVENWDSTRDIKYRLNHNDYAYYSGIVKKDPVEKDTIVIAAFTGNSIYPQHAGDIQRTDIVENIKKIKPDLLFFSGDQVYDHTHHYAYWLKFGRDFGEVIRNIPTITIPDDHDVGQGNLWGAEGKKSNTVAGWDGGYYMPVEYVKEVERAQTSHLPDPYDPTPVKRGIGVYYTQLTLGRISFAIIEDRKFKSGPIGLIPQLGNRLERITIPKYDTESLDVPGAKLLGERQLKFLHEWAADWGNSDMKCVLSQTIFCAGAHCTRTADSRRYYDFDSNGWPRTGRNKALAEMRRAFAFHIAGDQHLGTIFHHGIEDWDDAGYSFCVPSIANLYCRWWAPSKPGKNRKPGMPEYTGQHLDDFGNKVTCYAAANPSLDSKPEDQGNGKQLTTRAAGFGIVKFNKPSRKITMECWPRNVDITSHGAEQYPGWPLTIHQADNYAKKAKAYLPTLRIYNIINPVVQVFDESQNEIVYTLRINGQQFSPKVFHEGKYTIKISNDDKIKVLEGIKAVTEKGSKAIEVSF